MAQAIEEIEDRMILLLTERKNVGHGFWEWLADTTGIMSRRWRKLYARGQRATSDMVEAMAKVFPQYAFWLVTGVTDATNGHIAPATAQVFPERTRALWAADECEPCKRYFELSLALAERAYEMGPSARSRLSEVGSDLTEREEYKALIETWKHRESERVSRVAAIRLATDSETSLFYGHANVYDRESIDYELLRSGFTHISTTPPKDWTVLNVATAREWMSRAKGVDALTILGYLVQYRLLPDGGDDAWLPFTAESIAGVMELVDQKRRANDDN